MKQVSVVSGLISILFGIVVMSYSAETEAKKRTSKYRCSYTHTVIDEFDNTRTSTVISADVAAPMFCPEIPADVFRIEVGEAALKAHITSGVGTEDPEDVACLHEELPWYVL